jgi:hypothetical protein
MTYTTYTAYMTYTTYMTYMTYMTYTGIAGRCGPILDPYRRLFENTNCAVILVIVTSTTNTSEAVQASLI